MALVVAIVVIVALVGFVFYAIAHEPGPGAPDVAIGYERAWDELEFGLLWDLSGPELRDGLRRDQFVAAKRAAYSKAEAPARLGARIAVETSVAGQQSALVVTRVAAGGGSVLNNVMLDHSANGWVVVGYALRPDTEAGPSAS